MRTDAEAEHAAYDELLGHPVENAILSPGQLFHFGFRAGADHARKNSEALIGWVKHRIEECRKQEAKFGSTLRVSSAQIPQSLIEAWTERSTLDAVLSFLEGK